MQQWPLSRVNHSMKLASLMRCKACIKVEILISLFSFFSMWDTILQKCFWTQITQSVLTLNTTAAS